MGDIGIKASEKGYDIKTVADRFKVFTSSFQTLKIYDTYSVSVDVPAEDAEFSSDSSTDNFTVANHGLLNGDQLEFVDFGSGLPTPIVEDTTYYVVQETTNTFKVSTTDGGSAVNLTSSTNNDSEYWPYDKTITINHNLGFFAPYMVIYNGESNNTASVNNFLFTDKQYINKLEIDVSNLAGGSVAYFSVYIFLEDFNTTTQLNLESNIDNLGSNNNYGFKVSKEGVSVKAGNDEDMIISSSFFNQLIHKKGNQSYTSGYSVSHDLGYTPNYLSFSKQPSDSFIQSKFGSFGLASIDDNNLYFDTNLNFESQLYYIIFKNKI